MFKKLSKTPILSQRSSKIQQQSATQKICITPQGDFRFFCQKIRQVESDAFSKADTFFFEKFLLSKMYGR